MRKKDRPAVQNKEPTIWGSWEQQASHAKQASEPTAEKDRPDTNCVHMDEQSWATKWRVMRQEACRSYIRSADQGHVGTRHLRGKNIVWILME